MASSIMASSFSSSSGANKSRRELFEEQLQDLQRDISSLSSKLAVPNLVTSARLNNSSMQTSFLDSSLHSTTNDATKVSNLPSDLGSSPSVGNNPAELDLKNQLETAKEELRKALRDKDEALMRVEQLKKEVEELQKNTFEIAKLKVVIDTLKQDNEALKLSLESSERLRVQQKDLIAMLHKSHALMGEASVVSFNSISSISHRGDADSLQPLPSMGNNSVGETRDWVSPSPQAVQATPTPSHPSRSAGTKSSKRTSSSATPAASSSQRTPVGTPSSSARKLHPSTPSASKAKVSTPSTTTKGRSKPHSTPESASAAAAASAAHQTFSEIMATNPSLVPTNAFPGYPSDWPSRPSYATLQCAGAFPAMFPPSFTPHNTLATNASSLPFYPESAGQNGSAFWNAQMTPSMPHLSALSEGVGRPPLYPHSRFHSPSAASSTNPPAMPSSVPVSLPSYMPQYSTPPVTPAKHKAASGPSGSKAATKKKPSKKTTTTSKETKRSSSAPAVARVLVRPVASPPSTFSRATRPFGR